MKKIKLFLLLIPFTLLSPALNAAPINDDAALKVADDFMFAGDKKLLKKYDRQLLNLDQLYVINYTLQDQPKGFVVVANDDSLPSLILAFSREGKINITNSTMQSILEQYNKEITEWQQGKAQSTTEDTIYYQKGDSTQLPFLKVNYWHQNYPYNHLMPEDIDGERSPAGCATIAMAEIMNYYQYPAYGTGKSTYTQTNKRGKRFSATTNHDSLRIDWNSLADRYNRQDYTIASTSICPLLYHCAVSTESNFASDVTIAFIGPATTALYKHFGYHPSIRTIRTHTLSDAQLQQLLYRELEAKRPVLCCGHSHFFVCDGFTDDYFHFNWGWGGEMNGYFKLSALKAGTNNFKLVYDITVNILPGNPEEQHKTVTLSQPGTLHQHISNDEAQTLTSLTITGKLNGKDVRLLRKMAGATQSIWENGGKLHTLDLSKATIAEDYENFYYRIDLRKEKWTMTYNDKNTPDGKPLTFMFETMDDKEWELFCQHEGKTNNQNPIRKYAKEGNDYYLQHYSSLNYIGDNMFKDCTNLQNILLPEQTTGLGICAFMNCKSLQQMQLPPQINYIQSKVWLDCISMKAVTVHPSNPHFISKDGVLYSKDLSTLVHYPTYKTDSIYDVPQTTQKIYPFAFNGSLFLQKVKLSEQIKEIPPYVFSSCPTLRSVQLPEGLEQIKANAFCLCKELSEVNLPAKFQDAREKIFNQCNQLK